MHVGEKYMRAYILDSETGKIVAFNENNQIFKHDSTSRNLIVGLMDYVYKVFDIDNMDMI